MPEPQKAGAERRRRLGFAAALLLGAVSLLAVVPATGQAPGGAATFRLSPNVAGQGSRLIVDAQNFGSAGGPRVTSTVLGLQRGFELDVRSRTGRCTRAQAESFSCPTAAKIGTGFAIVRATGAVVPNGSQDFRAEIDVHLAPKRRATDLAGVVISVQEPVTGQRGTAYGRLLSRPRQAFGQQLRFDSFPAVGAPPPGVTVTLRRLHLEAAAFRRVRRNGRRVRLTLIRNPGGCRGAWRARSQVGFADGTSRTTFLRAGCRAVRSTPKP